MKTDIARQNHWALDKEGLRIHISKASSGANGYNCIGCTANMIAHMGNKNEHHFKHDPKEIHKHAHCTFSDETYRHKIAKEILQRIKGIKVREVAGIFYEGNMAHEFLIHDFRFIKAHSVKIELNVFENTLGQINISKDFDSIDTTKHFLIKPDAIFFDNLGKPILFIEIKCTNKVDHEKLAKLYRLGIDTVEVHIPEHFNEEDIENIFSITEHTKWLYSNEQSIEFDPSIHSVRKRSRRVDVNEEEILFIESVSCRQFRITEAIRRIKKFMGNYEFKTASEGIISDKARVLGEIRRVDQSTAEIGFAMGKIVRRARAELETRGRKPIYESKRDFAQLERRYLSKRSELNKKQIRFNTINIKYKRRVGHFEEIARDQIRRIKQRIKDIDQEVGFNQIDATYYDQQERDLSERMAQLEAEENKIGRERKIFEDSSRRTPLANSERSDQDVRQLIERITNETTKLQDLEHAFIKSRDNQ